MKTNDFISKWVFNIPGEKIDQLSNEFGTDFSNEDVEEAILSADLKKPKTIGASIWLKFMEELKESLSNEYPNFIEDKFEWDSSIDVGSDAVDIYYDGKVFNNNFELENLLEEQDKLDNAI